ncbi:endolytic transglycosylase MltG [Alkalithermobacter paradoxus]|uniref:Endolytic murein transglycosylase n=1 Tax=Alkalithermobacter paradoxus TaxID=29349 RepID=A0A1V4IAS6_9FIRM|nr:putative aminodeoxychorismate lyase [[Clostridium] thermoalcaliphilum]
MKKRQRAVLMIVTFFILSAAYFYNQVGPYDKNSGDEILVEIPKGSSLYKISDILFENNLIKSKLFFINLSKITNMDRNIQAGTYKIPQYFSNKDILKLLNSGDVYRDFVTVTIPEGFELVQIAQRLSEQGLVNREKFIELANNVEIFRKEFEFLNEEDIISLEGYLFPDTYFIDKSYSEKTIIRIMLNRFKEIYSDEYKARQKELGLSLNELITMSSIIEREAQVKNERVLISAVFHNRINIDMPLQSCATVQYVIGERKPVLSYNDIQIDSPYNTYKNKGLPPGPIASPGEAAIKAALYPADVNYLYFVAKKDGSHSFATNYSDHLKNRRENLGR